MADQKIVITEADLLFIRGRNLLAGGDPGQAAKVFAELVNEFGGNGKAWCMLGDIFQFHLMDYIRSSSCYSKAIELEPLFAATYLGYAELLFKTGKFAESNAMLNQAIDLAEAPVDQVRLQIAMLKESQGRYDEAEADYKKALLASFDNKTIDACELGMERCKTKSAYARKS